MKKLLLLSCFIIVTIASFARIKLCPDYVPPDRLIIGKDTVKLQTRPFNKLDSVQRAALQLRIRQTPNSTRHNFLGRNYLVYWRLRNDSLLLEHVYRNSMDIGEEPTDRIDMSGFFPDGKYASWFDGDLITEQTNKSTRDSIEIFRTLTTTYTIKRGIKINKEEHVSILEIIGSEGTFYKAAYSIGETMDFNKILGPDSADVKIIIAFDYTPDTLGRFQKFDDVKLFMGADSLRLVDSDPINHPVTKALGEKLKTLAPYGERVDGKMERNSQMVILKPTPEKYWR